MKKDNWGHKVIIYIYVEGDYESATSENVIEAANRAASMIDPSDKRINFVGAKIEPVAEEPKEMMGA